MGLLRGVCLEEAGLEEAGLKEAGLKEAGLEEAGLMRTTCGSVGPQSPKIIPRRRCWKACRKHILRHPLRIFFKFEEHCRMDVLKTQRSRCDSIKLASKRLATRRLAWRRLASRRLASRRLASRLATRRLASRRLG